MPVRITSNRAAYKARPKSYSPRPSFALNSPKTMRDLWDKLVDKASDAGEFVENVTRNGIQFLRSTAGKLPLFKHRR